MIEAFTGILRQHPEVTFFLVLGIGYVLGKAKLGSFTLGAVTGTLLAGVAVGQLGVQVSGEVKQSFFLLFLFSIGFRTGPQFFRGLKSDGVHQAIVAAIVATTGLIVAYVVSRILGYDAGTGAGLIAGALTESATIGTAIDAISHLDLPEAERLAMANRIPVAFAVTYLIGVIGAAWFLAQLAPKLMRVNLEEECRRFEQELQGGVESGSASRRDIEYRAYMVQRGSPLVGRFLRELEHRVSDARLFIERIRRGGQVIDGDENITVQAGDTLAITGWRDRLVASIDEQAFGLLEVDDKGLLDVPAEVLDVVVTNADRKGGHVLARADGHRYGVDHGVTLHAEDKLRTVLWGWAGRALPEEEQKAVRRLLDDDAVRRPLRAALRELLTVDELEALDRRVRTLLRAGTMPLPGTGWPSIPWPPF